MNDEYVTYIIGYSFIFWGLLVGGFAEYFLMKKLRRKALSTTWKGDDVIFFGIKGLVFILCTIMGVYFTFRYLPFNEQVKNMAGYVFFSVSVLLITIFTSRVVVSLIRARASKSLGLLRTGSIMANIARIIIYILGFLIILQGLGISITPLLTALGVGGLAVALALQDTLSNLFSGVQIIASKQMRPGDYVKLASGEEGYVTDITWRNTIIRMLSNNIVVVPNSKIATSILTNYYLPDKEVSVGVEVSVSYDSNLEQVEAITVDTAREVIKNVQGTVKSHDPFIRYHTFGDSGIGFSVILRGQEFTDQYLIKHEFVKALQKNYMKHNIEIPFPMRTVLLRREKTLRN